MFDHWLNGVYVTVTVSRDALIFRLGIFFWLIVECEVSIWACLPVGYDNSAQMQHKHSRRQTIAQLLHYYLSSWIGQMVSGGELVEWTCDGQSVREWGTQPFNENLWPALIKDLTERLWQVLMLTCINDVDGRRGCLGEMWLCEINPQRAWVAFKNGLETVKQPRRGETTASTPWRERTHTQRKHWKFTSQYNESKKGLH